MMYDTDTISLDIMIAANAVQHLMATANTKKKEEWLLHGQS